MGAFDAFHKEVMILLAQYSCSSLFRLWCYVKFSSYRRLICICRGWLKCWKAFVTVLWPGFLLFLCCLGFFFCSTFVHCEAHKSCFLKYGWQAFAKAWFCFKWIKTFCIEVALQVKTLLEKISKAYLKNMFHLNVHVEQVLNDSMYLGLKSAVMHKPATWELWEIIC